MRMIKAKDDSTLYIKEHKGAESHLLRAGYDAYELICINQIEYIKNVLEQYTPNDISIGFPDYYTEIRISIVDIEKETARLRQSKAKENGALDDGFKYYFASAEKLIGYVKRIDTRLPIIAECYNARLKEENKLQKPSKLGVYIGIAGFIVGIIGILFAILY
jgi:hypothetical protein